MTDLVASWDQLRTGTSAERQVAFASLFVQIQKSAVKVSRNDPDLEPEIHQTAGLSIWKRAQTLPWLKTESAVGAYIRITCLNVFRSELRRRRTAREGRAALKGTAALREGTVALQQAYGDSLEARATLKTFARLEAELIPAVVASKRPSSRDAFALDCEQMLGLATGALTLRDILGDDYVAARGKLYQRYARARKGLLEYLKRAVEQREMSELDASALRDAIKALSRRRTEDPGTTSREQTDE